MNPKNLIMLAMVLALLLAIPALVIAKRDGRAKAKPPTKISATFEFNLGPPLEVTGKAKGLSPGKNYHSAVYGFGSTIKGINACKPKDPVGGSMFAGNWSAVTSDGTATLLRVTNADLDKIATISVRSGIGGVPGSIVLVFGKVTP